MAKLQESQLMYALESSIHSKITIYSGLQNPINPSTYHLKDISTLKHREWTIKHVPDAMPTDSFGGVVGMDLECKRGCGTMYFVFRLF